MRIEIFGDLSLSVTYKTEKEGKAPLSTVVVVDVVERMFDKNVFVFERSLVCTLHGGHRKRKRNIKITTFYCPRC